VNLTPAAAKILLIADGDSRIAWVRRLGALLGQALYGHADCTTFLPGNAVQTCAALFQRRQLDLSAFDLVLIGYGGGANLRFSNAYAEFFAHHPHAIRRPLLLAGFNGICDAEDPHALFVRTGADLIFANCVADLKKFDHWLARVGGSANTELLGYVRHTTSTEKTQTPQAPQPTVLFIAQPGAPATLKERLYILQSLQTLAQRYPDWSIQLKLRSSTLDATVTHHEKFRYQDIARIFFKNGPSNLRLTNQAIAQLLESATVCVTLGSTVAMEAITRGITTVIMSDFGIRRDYGNHHFLGSQCLMPLNTLALPQLNHQADRDWQRQHIAFADENISRIAARIKTMLHQQIRSNRSLPLPQPIYSCRDHPYLAQDRLRPKLTFWQKHYFCLRKVLIGVLKKMQR